MSDDPDPLSDFLIGYLVPLGVVLLLLALAVAIL